MRRAFIVVVLLACLSIMISIGLAVLPGRGPNKRTEYISLAFGFFYLLAGILSLVALVLIIYHAIVTFNLTDFFSMVVIIFGFIIVGLADWGIEKAKKRLYKKKGGRR